MQRLSFYFTYAYRNLRRSLHWTLLAILCIAAGVSTVVALRSLGLAIGDSLIENVRYDNRGDINLRLDRATLGFTFDADGEAFTAAQVSRTETWALEHNARISPYRIGSFTQVTGVNDNIVGRPQFVSSFYIDPSNYPPLGSVNMIEPPQASLAALLTDPSDVIISANLAESESLQVGDQVRISGTDTPFTIKGIVDTAAEAGIRNLFGAFFGFIYLDLNTAGQYFDDVQGPNRIGVLFNEIPDEAGINRYRSELKEVSGAFGSDTANSLLERNEAISRVLGDFIVLMGLGALLIGGVGIMNTMLVMVRRRTEEIASLKTFGLKGRQILSLFAVEAFLLGLVGSVVGVFTGVLLGRLVNQYGETFLQQALPWKIYPEAILYGLVLGMLISVVFGIAPILTANKVSPASILRPNESQAPGLGTLQSIGLLVFVTLMIGLIVGQILSPSFALTSFASSTPYISGIIAVAITMMLLGVLILLLWVLVALIGKLPALGSVDLRLALRNFSTKRLRTATTLLALSAGMFALSSITFIGQGTRELLNLQLVNQFGGNVLAFPLLPGEVGATAINLALADNKGINGRVRWGFLNTSIISVDGKDVSKDFDMENMEGFTPPAWIFWNRVTSLTADKPYPWNTAVIEGRLLTPEDRGKAYIVGPASQAQPLGIHIGSILKYKANNQTIDFEVVGLVADTEGPVGGGVVYIPDGVVSGGGLDFSIYVYDVDPEHVNQALVDLSAVPLVFGLDVKFIDSLIGRFINQFSAIPTVVGLLSLAAAGVIMANTVALSTLERRRQIGILKSLGLKKRRVLFIMLIESTIVGLLSAVLGIGLSMVIVSLMTSLGGIAIPLPTDARTVAVLLVVAAVVISWLATFLSAGVPLRERVMNVLRYE